MKSYIGWEFGFAHIYYAFSTINICIFLRLEVEMSRIVGWYLTRFCASVSLHKGGSILSQYIDVLWMQNRHHWRPTPRDLVATLLPRPQRRLCQIHFWRFCCLPSFGTLVARGLCLEAHAVWPREGPVLVPASEGRPLDVGTRSIDLAVGTRSLHPKDVIFVAGSVPEFDLPEGLS